MKTTALPYPSGCQQTLFLAHALTNSTILSVGFQARPRVTRNEEEFPTRHEEPIGQEFWQSVYLKAKRLFFFTKLRGRNDILVKLG